MIHISTSLIQRIERADAAINAAYIEARQEFAPEAASHRVGSATLLFAGDKSPINRGLGFGIEAPTEGALHEIEAWFKIRQCPARLEVSPFVSPSCLPLLAKHQYHLLSFKSAWILPASSLAFERPETSRDVRVIEPSERDLWAEVVGKGFAGREDNISFDASIGRPTASSRVATCFFALEGAEPIAGASVTISDGIALLSSMSTRPAYRRRGAQRALLAARLRFAKEAGCELIITHTTPTNTSSQRNVERAGFQLLYTSATLGL